MEIGAPLQLLDKFCRINKFREKEMDTEALYVALAERGLTDGNRSELKKKAETALP